MVELLCLTHDRPGLITTPGVLGDEVVLSVAKSQVAAYREAHPELRIDPHPDKVVGLPAKKTYLVEKYGDVFMLDDDVLAFVDHVEGSRLEPTKACEVIRRLADQAKQMGAKIFGFSGDANPMHYSPQQPFVLSGLIDGGKFGCLGGETWWPADPDYGLCEDMWACGVNAYENRFLLKDLRYALVGPSPSADIPGGLGSTRTHRAMEKAAKLLKDSFGDAVEFKDPEEAAKYYWRLRVPW